MAVGGLVKAGLSTPIVNMVAKVYVPTLFPLTFLIMLFSVNLDRMLDPWLHSADGFLPVPANYVIGAVTFIIGLLLWLWTYQQLTVLGEGSPSPTAGRTQKLVKTGIYAYSRNPSLFGKILGVLAVGFVVNSFTFCFVILPLLLAVSLAEKVIRQEPQLVEIFGEDYLAYQKRVPLFLPWGLIFPHKRWK